MNEIIHYRIIDCSINGGVLFEGSENSTYNYLIENSALDAPPYMVYNCVTGDEIEEGEFMRRFEERVKNETPAEHVCLTQEMVQRIARGVVSDVVDELCEKIGLPKNVQTEEMGDALLKAIQAVAKKEVGRRI